MFRAATVYVILFAAVGAYSPFLQQYYQSLGIPIAEIGLLAAFTSAMALISAPMWGAIHDHLPGSRLLIPFAAAVAALGGLGLATAGATPLIVVAAAAFAIGMSGTSPMMDVRVLSIVGADRTRYGWIRACGSASFIVFGSVTRSVRGHDAVLKTSIADAVSGTGPRVASESARSFFVSASPSSAKACLIFHCALTKSESGALMLL